MKKMLFLGLALLNMAICPSGAFATDTNQQNLSLVGDHGSLSAVLQTPAQRKKYPLVIIMHGFNANKEMNLLTELASQLQARGMATLQFDFNGHGESEGSFLDMTIPNELEDARRVYAYARTLPKVSSISVVGHSQGAVVAAMLAGELGAKKIKSVALMAPATELKEDTAKGDLFGVKYNPEQVPDFITLSNGLKVGRAFLETTPHVSMLEISSQYTGPVLIVHSQDDQLVPYKYGEEMSQIYQHAWLHTLHGFDHNFTQDITVVGKIIADFFEQKLVK